MQTLLKQMIQAGLHFGHTKDQWHPKMLPYIYQEKNGVHIIDIIQTWFYIRKVSKFLEICTAQGQKVLFVGTKKQAAQLIETTAIRCNSYFVNKRWLGGLLTNWSTLQNSIFQLKQLQQQPLSNRFQQKKYDKLIKYFRGLQNMKQIPDIVIIIGQQKELNAVLECRKLGIRTITLLDTNCNPLLADLFVPANDDSISSIKFILDQFATAILKGEALYTTSLTEQKTKSI
uniref:Small ribosomal subunit protein uS2c n=1 Tax=Codium arabicum TaxID=221038 RepID=A0A386B0K4_CODAR|nr:ribosomal protein S2 [Codium arabicum]AYC65217.1 ribosomal protein S2 [Codium arabicum]